jgi:hypothetical protein
MGLSGYSSVHCPPGCFKRVDDMRLDAQQAQFEHLKQACGTSANDDHFGRNDLFAQGIYAHEDQ